MPTRLILSSLLMLVTLPAVAQRITAPVETATCQLDSSPGLLDRWAREFFNLRTDAESRELRASIIREMKRAEMSSSRPCPFDFRRPHSIVFAVPEQAPTKVTVPLTLVRLLVWNEEDPLYTTNLRGIDELVEVFITPNEKDGLSSFYTSTPVEDPREAELAAAIKQLGPGLFGQLSPTRPVPAIEAVPPTTKYFVHVGRVVIPIPRAKISIKSQLNNTGEKSEKYNAKGEFAYDNVRLNRVGFSLIGAGIVRVAGARRSKIDSGKIVEDSFDGAASIFAVNIHPWRYDPTELPISRAERWRFFVGIVATPELGIATGIGWAPFRKLSLNLGYAWLRVKETKPGEVVGNQPQAADPFRRRAAGALVLGAGYKFS